MSEATALMQWTLPPVFQTLRDALRLHTRRPDREWVQVLQLLEDVTEQELETAVEEAIERGSPRLETIRLLLRHAKQEPRTSVEPVELKRQDLATLSVAQPSLAAYDVLWSGS